MMSMPPLSNSPAGLSIQQIVDYLPPVRLTAPAVVVDVGGNSLEILVVFPNRTIHTQKFPLISGKSIGEYGLISVEAEAVLQQAAQHVVEQLTDWGVPSHQILAVATAGLRDAQNGQAVADRLNKAGLPVRIIDGLEEARLIYSSVLKGVSIESDEPVLVLEIGGGSTELAAGKGPYQCDLDMSHVLPLGTGRLSLPNIHDAQQIVALSQIIETQCQLLIPPARWPQYQGRRIFMKYAPEWDRLRQEVWQTSQQDIHREGVSQPDIARWLSPVLAPALNIVLSQEWENSASSVRKLFLKLLIIREVMHMCQTTHLCFGPDWGLKMGLMESLLLSLASGV